MGSPTMRMGTTATIGNLKSADSRVTITAQLLLP
jgi:hypothetical protein